MLSDAHLGHEPPAVEEALVELLERAPTLAEAVLITGDLHDFWFGYRHVIPRAALRVTAALVQAARRMPVALVGGNHDRWGGTDWATGTGLQLALHRLEGRVGGRRFLALHGDGVGGSAGAGLAHRVVTHPWTSALFGLLHPDFGLPLVRRLRPLLTGDPRDMVASEARARRLASWTRSTLAARPEVDLIIHGHAHGAVLEEALPGRWVLNPGPWFDGHRYALVTREGITLHPA